MDRISASTGIFLALVAPVVAAQSSERSESLPDANPACMERNGPDCVLGTQVIPARRAAPPGPGVPPTGVVVVPSSTVTPPGVAASGTPLPRSGVVVIVPPAPATPSGTVIPQGVVGSSSSTSSANSTTAVPAGSTLIAPAGSTVISPRAVR